MEPVRQLLDLLWLPPVCWILPCQMHQMSVAMTCCTDHFSNLCQATDRTPMSQVSLSWITEGSPNPATVGTWATLRTHRWTECSLQKLRLLQSTVHDPNKLLSRSRNVPGWSNIMHHKMGLPSIQVTTVPRANVSCFWLWNHHCCKNLAPGHF